MSNNGVKLFYDTVLQKNDSSGRGKSCPHRLEELSVTETPQYDSPAEREYAEQEKLKDWYETNTGSQYRYALQNFRKNFVLSADG